MTPEEFRFASRSLDDLLRNPRDLSSASAFAEALENIPDDLDFELAAEADIPWLPDYLERVYGWSRKGPRP